MESLGGLGGRMGSRLGLRAYLNPKSKQNQSPKHLKNQKVIFSRIFWGSGKVLGSRA